MSLILSIPFNNSVRNFGLQKNTITSVPSVTPSYIAGPVNNALSFNGSTYWKSQGITLGTEATICCWSKTGTNGKMSWVLESDAISILNLYESTIYTLNTGDSNNNPFKTDSNSYISVIHDNAWHHFAVTFGNNVAKLYIDGAYCGKAITFRSPKTTNKPIKIGGGYRDTHSYDWNGGIADFRVYDNCLMESDIQRIYSNNSNFLVLSFPLNKDFRNVGLVNAKTSKIGNASIIEDQNFGGCLQAGNGTQITNGVSCATNLLNELSGQKYSCSIWVRPKGNHVHYNGTFFSSGNWNNKSWAFGVNDTNTKVDMFGPWHNKYVSCSIQLNEWTHLISTYDNKSAKLYKNGEFVTGYTFPDSYVFSSDTTSCAIGRETYAGGYFSFNGNIANLNVYNLVLTDTDVKRLYQNEEIILLPNEYEKLEYIQSTGTQWIDSGINPKIKPRVVAKMAILNNADKDYWGNNAINGSAYYADFSYYKLTYYRYGSTTYQNVNFTVGQDEIHIWDVSDKVYVDGSLKFTSTNTYTYNSSQSTILIFKAARGSFYSSYKLYNFKLYDDDELCRNFVPAKRKSDSVIGLYDMVSRQFFTNAGTGSFTGA